MTDAYAFLPFLQPALGPNTRPEHILLDALGGRITTRRVVCSGCNNGFGSDIDDAFAGQVTEVRNLLRLESGSGSAPPSLRRVKAGDQVLNLSGDGRIDLVQKPFSTSRNTDGTVSISIMARSVEQIDRLLPHIAASIGMPEEKLREQIASAVGSMIEQRPNTIHFPLSFGGVDSFWSAVKSCLVLWATSAGIEEVRGEPYRTAREFVTSGDKTFYLSSTKLDTRQLPILEDFIPTYGPVFNLVHVQSDAAGRVVGHFTLYNLIAFQAVLANAGGTPNCKTTIVSNAEKPEVWSKTVDLDLAEPEYDVSEARARFEGLLSHYTESGRSDEFERIIRDVLEKNGLREGDPIPVDLAHKISGEIAHRAAMHQVGLPFQEQMTFPQLRRGEPGDKTN